jgi:hypothetical protein
MKRLQLNLTLAGLGQLVWLATSGAIAAEGMRGTLSKENLAIYFPVWIISIAWTAIYYAKSNNAVTKRRK